MGGTLFNMCFGEIRDVVMSSKTFQLLSCTCWLVLRAGFMKVHLLSVSTWLQNLYRHDFISLGYLISPVLNHSRYWRTFWWTDRVFAIESDGCTYSCRVFIECLLCARLCTKHWRYSAVVSRWDCHSNGVRLVCLFLSTFLYHLLDLRICGTQCSVLPNWIVME